MENWREITSLRTNTTSYVDSNVIDGMRYYYQIHANVNTEIASVTTSMNAPSNLSARINPMNLVSLSWEDNSLSEEGYHVKRRQGSSNYKIIATVGREKTSYIDSTIMEQGSYFYVIQGYNSFVENAYSNEFEVEIK